MDVPRQIARRAVDLAAIVAPPRRLLRRFERSRAFREYPDMAVVDHATLPMRISDDVVVELSFDLPMMVVRVLRQDLPAIEALFLA